MTFRSTQVRMITVTGTSSAMIASRASDSSHGLCEISTKDTSDLPPRSPVHLAQYDIDGPQDDNHVGHEIPHRHPPQRREVRERRAAYLLPPRLVASLRRQIHAVLAAWAPHLHARFTGRH